MLIERVVVFGDEFSDGERIKRDLETLVPFGLCEVADCGANPSVERNRRRSTDVLTRAAAAALGIRCTSYPTTKEDAEKEPGSRPGCRPGCAARSHHRDERMLRVVGPDIVLVYPTDAQGKTWQSVQIALGLGHLVAVWAPDFDVVWTSVTGRHVSLFDENPRFILKPFASRSLLDVQHVAEVLDG